VAEKMQKFTRESKGGYPDQMVEVGKSTKKREASRTWDGKRETCEFLGTKKGGENFVTLIYERMGVQSNWGGKNAEERRKKKPEGRCGKGGGRLLEQKSRPSDPKMLQGKVRCAKKQGFEGTCVLVRRRKKDGSGGEKGFGNSEEAAQMGEVACGEREKESGKGLQWWGVVQESENWLSRRG